MTFFFEMVTLFTVQRIPCSNILETIKLYQREWVVETNHRNQNITWCYKSKKYPLVRAYDPLVSTTLS